MPSTASILRAGGRGKTPHPREGIMNAKRMLIAGILALEMAAPLASFAAVAPRPAPDSEATASDASALVAQPPGQERRQRRRRAHQQGYERALREKNRGASGFEVARAFTNTVVNNINVNVNLGDICLINAINSANVVAARGGDANAVINQIQANQC
jgi:hypothetical protein